MHVVFDAGQNSHKPIVQLFAGRLITAPECPDRTKQLLDGALLKGLRQVAATDHGWSAILDIHDGSYVKFLQRASELWRGLDNAGAEVVPHVHPVRYSRNRPNSILGLAGFYMNGTNCPIGQNTCDAAYKSAQTAITGAALVSSGSQWAYALCRPPGHHAHSDLAAGFCFLNNCAIAANRLTGKFGKVAIIDIDLHHGNGTQEIFYARDDVFCGSVHADPSDCYPFYQGYSDETGEGRGINWNMNVPLKFGSGVADLVAASQQLVDRAKALGCAAVVVALGFDTFAGDPMGAFSVTTDEFVQIGSVFASTGLPTLLVQEGGYAGPHLAANIASFLSAFVDNETKSFVAQPG